MLGLLPVRSRNNSHAVGGAFEHRVDAGLVIETVFAFVDRVALFLRVHVGAAIAAFVDVVVGRDAVLVRFADVRAVGRTIDALNGIVAAVTSSERDKSKSEDSPFRNHESLLESVWSADCAD